jgi:hypothetical protein
MGNCATSDSKQFYIFEREKTTDTCYKYFKHGQLRELNNLLEIIIRQMDIYHSKPSYRISDLEFNSTWRGISGALSGTMGTVFKGQQYIDHSPHLYAEFLNTAQLTLQLFEAKKASPIFKHIPMLEWMYPVDFFKNFKSVVEKGYKRPQRDKPIHIDLVEAPTLPLPLAPSAPPPPPAHPPRHYPSAHAKKTGKCTAKV